MQKGGDTLSPPSGDTMREPYNGEPTTIWYRVWYDRITKVHVTRATDANVWVVATSDTQHRTKRLPSYGPLIFPTFEEARGHLVKEHTAQIARSIRNAAACVRDEANAREKLAAAEKLTDDQIQEESIDPPRKITDKDL